MTSKDGYVQTVGMLVFRNSFKEVLLTKHKLSAKHKTGTYGIPAGRIERGESPVDALLREFNQETGLKTDQENILKLPFSYEAVIQRKNEEPRMFSLNVWYCKAFQGEPIEMEENVPEWVSVDKLEHYKLLPNMKKVVEDAKYYLLNKL